MYKKLYTLDGFQFIKKTDIIPNNFTGIVEYWNQTKEWFLNGNLHRIDGPAAECVDGTIYWYINNEEVSEEQHDLLCSIMKLKGLL